MADSRSEKIEIKKMGGKAQKNSGRSLHEKGDAILGPFIVDVKEYEKSFSLSRNVWGKISTDASKHRKEPALMVCLGIAENTTRLWVVGNDMFHDMFLAYQEKYCE
jgi:hypothetical protein